MLLLFILALVFLNSMAKDVRVVLVPHKAHHFHVLHTGLRSSTPAKTQTRPKTHLIFWSAPIRRLKVRKKNENSAKSMHSIMQSAFASEGEKKTKRLAISQGVMGMNNEQSCPSSFQIVSCHSAKHLWS